MACTRSGERIRSAVVAQRCSLQPVMSTAYQIFEPSRPINWPDGRLRVKSQELTLSLADLDIDYAGLCEERLILLCHILTLIKIFEL